MDEALLQQIRQRLVILERSRRRFQIALVLFGLSTAAALLAQSLRAQGSTDVLRARGLIIEDTNGRARITVGAPLPEDGRSGDNVRTGIRVNDPNGVERFALYLLTNGRISAGFDAPPGKGDDRNRERINIVADENGTAYIRFLDRRTYVPARIYLDQENRVWMEFSDFSQDPTVRRRIGLMGEETIRAPR